MPAFVCASEEVAVTWDAGEQTDSPACRPGLVGSGAGDSPSRDRCILVDRSSSPSLPRWEGAGDIRSQGTIVVSVTETTTFDAHAAVANYEGSGRAVALDASATARVIEETEPPGLCGAEMTTGVPPSFGILVHVQCNRDLPSCAF